MLDARERFIEQFQGTLPDPDFVQLAESFGAVGMRTEPEGLDAALQEALATDAPVVLEVRLPNLMPPFHLV